MHATLLQNGKNGISMTVSIFLGFLHGLKIIKTGRNLRLTADMKAQHLAFAK